jgi:hypothetical protein
MGHHFCTCLKFLNTYGGGGRMKTIVNNKSAAAALCGLEGKFALVIIPLKGQCHEIFDPRFFRQSITPRPLINTLKYFRILFRIRRAIRPLSLIPRYDA